MVTGAGIARGYLNQPALTHQKFITSVNGSRIYRTGDIGCLDSEGNLLFSGRRDSQVKIRGHRVEMDEVEQAILNVREVQQAVVKTFQDDDGFYFLVAYYKSAVTLEVQLFHNALRSALPAYSIPSYFVAVSEFPLTGHGKIDKDQLGPPPLLNDAGYAAPRTKTEKDLALIWSKILNVDQVGLHDNFFTLGGHSLKATALISEINRVLKKRIDIDVIFSHATLRDLAFWLLPLPKHRRSN
jgi:bacitracin synthase 3